MTDQGRFRLARGGVVNVWQYDRQIFDFADGRLLLRGANGAGKSKTMEMLLPFAIDGDKARLTASGRHHTSLLWLLLDGYEGQARTGYVWVEFQRVGDDGETVSLTCGVGLRATQSARAATSWFFTSPLRVGDGLELEGDGGPLSKAQLEALVTADEQGQVFDSAARYREHVGQTLFGLPSDEYDDLLRLIYWLRQPQVGEDIDPKRLAEQLLNALPQLDDTALRAAGDTFDELEAFGEELERRARAATALSSFVETYAGYARAAIADRAARVVDADSRVRQAASQLRAAQRESRTVTDGLTVAETARVAADEQMATARAEIAALESGPEARSRMRLIEMGKRVEERRASAESANRRRDEEQARAHRSVETAVAEAGLVSRAAGDLADKVLAQLGTLTSSGVGVDSSVHTIIPSLTDASGSLAWEGDEGGTALDAGLARLVGWLGETSTALGQRQAALRVVRDGLRVLDTARLEAERRSRIEDAAQARSVEAGAALEVATTRREEVEGALLAALAQWKNSAVAEPFELPVLDVDGLDRLETVARGAVSRRVDELSLTRGRASARATQARARAEELRRERTEVASLVDPQPLAPAFIRERSADEAGAPFWQLVDFWADVPAEDRAGLEAALEAAGVLDAWVTPDGTIEGTRLDTHLVAEALEEATDGHDGREGEDTLVAVLRPDDSNSSDSSDDSDSSDSSDDSDDSDSSDSSNGQAVRVPASVVERVLRRVRLLGHGSESGLVQGLAVGRDGQWRSGPVHGRTTKDTAQFIGATARSAERARRLALLDDEIRSTDAAADEAETEVATAVGALGAIDAWLGARPSHHDVVRAWTVVDQRREAAHTTEAEHAAASRDAQESRTEAATRHTELVVLGETHGMPTTSEGLDALGERLDRAARDLDGHGSDTRSAQLGLERWHRAATAAREDAARAADEAAFAQAAASEARTLAGEHEALVAAEGASVRELEDRLEAARHLERQALTEAKERRVECDSLIGRRATLRERETAMAERLAEAEPALEDARTGLGMLDGLPGVVAAAATPDDAEPDSGGPDALVLAALDIGRLRELASRWVSQGALEARSNAVLQAISGLQAGDAAIHEPRVINEAGLLVALGRDEAGEHAIAELSRRLVAAVARDRGLLSERERKVFENHVLGQLGDALRQVRTRADELVQSMNDQLRDVTTSQGIKVRLRWKQRDDIPPEAGRTLSLLASPLSALLPGEKAELQENVHRLIAFSRAESPEEPYAVHLSRALDYRQWNRFTVQYHRPETGEWRNLERRTALSQGEQKVLCYLPLFAAAAAHFTSVAGAAPHAPRFVLLDDAFPKIDVRTHPLLFGLLVDLDLDFIITSERLWGTHATVPELAIYEALRSPGDRGIAQYQHRWDGRQLTAVGA